LSQVCGRLKKAIVLALELTAYRLQAVINSHHQRCIATTT